MFRPTIQFVLIGVIALGTAAEAFANGDLVLPSVFGDGMVLQQGSYAPVWGKALPNAKVRVRLDGVRARTKADESGNWLVELPTDGVSPGGPHELTVKSKREKVEFTDVLLGEVWVCSGQSNMEWPLTSSNNAESEIAAANYPNMRQFKVPHTVADEPRWDVEAEWMPCVPANAQSFSAVAYFFGRRLLQAQPDTPVGLIQTSWGGTPAEAWTSMKKLESIDSLNPLINRWEQTVANHPEAQKRYESQLTEWQKASEQAKSEGKDAPARPRPPLGPNHPHRTATLFNGMVNPLVPYGIRGAIWYQGESNAGRAHQYQTIFPAMINDWREQWGRGDFPFLFVQLANFQAVDTWPVESDWAELREAQSMTLDLPNTGQAVIIDIGEAGDIHPRNKQDVGARLAQSAFDVAYGMDVAESGPVYTSMEKEGDKIRLSFDHVHSGLMALGRDALYGFTVAGADREFHWAWAEIDGDKVVVWSKDEPDPVAVRYGWANNPVCNLYNKDGLPASPFRTDDWEGITVGKH